MKTLIQPGNSKLGKHIYMFNLPATREICGRTCKGCYAIKEQVRYRPVLPARELRYKASLQPDFTSRVLAEISALKTKPKYFRIHASGEFYDNAYISKWVRIAKHLPDITFYAYTKRVKELDFSELMAMKNVVIINSFYYGGLNYGKLDQAPKDAFICPDQPGKGIQCGETCNYCMTQQAQIKAPFFKQH